MADTSNALHLSSQQNGRGQSAVLQFLQDEFKPYPNRTKTVIRMVLSATLTMIILMTFRIPNGAIGVFFGLLLSRENPATTLKNGLQTIVAFMAGLVYVLVGVNIFVNEPLPHFLFIALSLALMFFVMRTAKYVSAAFGFCFIVVTALPVWDFAFPIEPRVDANLWAVVGVILAVGITILLEFILYPKPKATEEISRGLEIRLLRLQELFQAYRDGKDIDSSPELKDIQQLARLGIGRIRWFFNRINWDGDDDFKKAQWRIYISVVERLTDTAANFGASKGELGERDKSRLAALQTACRQLRETLVTGNLSLAYVWHFPTEISTALPLLPELEHSLQQLPLIPQEAPMEAGQGKEGAQRWQDWHWQHFFAEDAFVNVSYLQFAIKGTLAGLACYVFYSAVDWPGLGNSLTTCVVTALSTVGSSRQKQILRFGGFIAGGLIFGIGAQIFILPQIDSIFGFTLYFSAVTAIAAWIYTSSPRFSFLGIQMALAFYLVLFQDSAMETSLGMGWNLIAGTLLGLLAMWGIFDHLWTKPAILEMEEAFAANMRSLGRLALANTTSAHDIETMHGVREQINGYFAHMNRSADVILFEFGVRRKEHLARRSQLKAWQSVQESIFLAQLAVGHYLSFENRQGWPERLQAAFFQLDEALAEKWNRLELTLRNPTRQENVGHPLTFLLDNLYVEALSNHQDQLVDTSRHRLYAILDLKKQLVEMTLELDKNVSPARQ